MEKVKSLIPVDEIIEGWFVGFEIPNTTNFCIYECNYGGINESDKLQENKIPFIMHNDSGDCYGEGLAAFDGNSYSEHSWSNNHLLIMYDPEKRSMSPEALKIANDFCDILESTKLVLKNRTTNSGESK